MARILIVEDEEKLARFLELELIHEGYETEKSGNGIDAVDAVSRTDYDLVLLDVMLPGINGMEVLRRIRNMGGAGPDGTLKHIPPVIMLTARDQVMDKVAGLDAGAVDYITKPFAIEELLARIRVALKLYGTGARGMADDPGTVKKDEKAGGKDAAAGAKPGDEAGAQKTGVSPRAYGEGEALPGPEEGILRWNKLLLDTRKHRVFYDGNEIALTNREFLMLKTLLENTDIVLSRDTLLSKVCGYDYMGETNVIDVYVRYLRSKIDEAFHIKMIRTVRGVGYVIYSEDTDK